MIKRFLHSQLYRGIAYILCMTVLSSAIPQQGWRLLLNPDTAYAAPLTTTNTLLAQIPRDIDLPPAFASQIGQLGAAARSREMASATDPFSSMQRYGTSLAANPLSISRVQSAYRAADAVAGTLVVTFTVTNNQLPSIKPPALPPSATVTDTLAAFTSMDLSKDPNTVHNVLLADALTNDAAFVASTPTPDRRIPEYAWSLGDVPPLGVLTATLKLRIPGTVADFVDLDTGASAWGSLQGRSVHAQAYPMRLAPNAINGEPVGDWLKWTLDADTRDPQMLAKAAELGQDPARLFEYVRSLGYESYTGSLRGTRGTLWSAAGNSLDQASLLIAMLRASGVPSRYRHGSLSQALAQELISSMFAKPTQAIGHIPSGTRVSDPANDQQLLGETRDHWWVEVYLAGQGWRDLDPSFRAAAVGQRFVADGVIATDGSDRVAEVPDGLRHKVSITVKVESYYPLNVGNNGLAYTYPLSHTFNTVEVVGRPVSFGHLVKSDLSAGFFYAVQHNYTPYFSVGDRVTTGQPFQDLISNFPFGTFRITAEWLQFDVRNPLGKAERYEREIVDRIGVEQRQSGGTVNLGAKLGKEALFTDLDTHILHFAPAAISVAALIESRSTLMALTPRVAQAEALAPTLPQQSETTRQIAQRDLGALGRETMIAINQALAFSFGAISDSSTSQLATTAQVHAYADSPRIVIVSSAVVSSTVRQTIDLLRDPLRVTVAPGQALDAAYAFRMTRGVNETVLETMILERGLGKSPRSVAVVMEAAKSQHIPLVFVDADHLDALAKTQISDQAKARILTAVKAGNMVIVPQRMVTVEGQPAVGWWQIDPVSGETVGVGEDGTHQALINFTILGLALIFIGAALLMWVSGITATLWTLEVFIMNVISLLLTRTIFGQGYQGLFQAAFNRTKSMMLDMADQVERGCGFC
jgi:large repetitive protein